MERCVWGGLEREEGGEMESEGAEGDGEGVCVCVWSGWVDYQYREQVAACVTSKVYCITPELIMQP